jgi:hypothetical protein
MRFSRIVAIAAVTFGTAVAARAQLPGTLVVKLSGAVAADSSLRVHVELSTVGSSSSVVRLDSTGSQRSVRMAQVPVGRYRVETRALGFVPDTSFVEISSDRTASLSIALARITALDPVTVAGTNKGHVGAFETRRAAGKGTFLTRDDLAKTRRLTDALRSVRGMRVDCGSGNCRVLMVRSTTCEPRYFINGFPSNGEVLTTPVLDIAGVEIYRGPSEMPAEFMGSKSMCGAIVIWTK